MAKYLPCYKREGLVFFKADGSQHRGQICLEQEAPKANQQVSPEDCEACPVRRVINQAAVRSGELKPKEYPGPPIVNKAPDIYAEGFEPCADRLKGYVKLCCDKREPVWLCNSGACQFFGKEVTPVICEACPERRYRGD